MGAKIANCFGSRANAWSKPALLAPYPGLSPY
jgi:hypothetical protein